jgi:serine/threonine-protein kinase
MTADLLSPEFLALQTSVAGRYSLVRELGRGGMGVVFLAREVALDRLVAIKLLPSGLATQPTLRDRFIREARTAAQLSHPHIVAIHAVEATEAVVFFVMEYVAGETLGARLRRVGALIPGDALRITQEVAWALAHAHARDVVHRDVKPDNILLEEGSDRAIVTDFGIAHAGISGNTPVGVGLGTFHYMSPEQAAGAPVDARTDVYALGVTAFHAVTGRRPFEGYDGAALLAQQAHTDPPSVTTLAPTLQLRFALAIDRATQRDVAARWESVEAMAQELGAARAVEPAQPVALAAFARESREFMGQAGFSASLAVLSELTFAIGFGFDDISGILFHAIASLLVAMSLTSLARVVGGARSVLRRGYQPAAVLRRLGTGFSITQGSSSARRWRSPESADCWSTQWMRFSRRFFCLRLSC